MIIQWIIIPVILTAILLLVTNRQSRKQPDWNEINAILNEAAFFVGWLINGAKLENAKRFDAIQKLCEALIEIGYVRPDLRRRAFEQSSGLIAILSTSHVDRVDCLGKSVGYYEMIGKHHDAQVVMNELYKTQPLKPEEDMPDELVKQTHMFWCQMIDGQRSVHRENYRKLF